MSARDKRRLRCNSSDRKLSREVVVRNNVKHDALSPYNQDRNRSNSSHAGNRSRLSDGPVRLRRNDPRGQQNRSSHEANVSQRQQDQRLHRALNRRRSNRNMSVHRKRRNSNSLSRSAVILARAKAKNHKPLTTDNTDQIRI